MKNSRYPNMDAELARAGVTRQKLAETLGCDAPAVTRKLNGQRKITLEDMRVICKVVNVPFNEETVDYLLAGEDVADGEEQ